MRPFENDKESMSLSGLSIDNGPDLIAIHGILEITRDRRSLQRVETLESLLGDIKAKLLSFGELPEVASPEIDPTKVDVVANPFGDN
ncbi:hypothetical protein [Rhizobium sp. MHM7A]|uniref:hypothetical protein n=1 Tax=Rhizobium sp. MHM7A TaxID=2583233 RepID=UPI0011057F1B|nr:hypothetical protein [Rhizobium sp. MHM7A]TLX16292.1 hypothetical protein FFR93_02890 [Rhizobium sp. MHM7A]